MGFFKALFGLFGGLGSRNKPQTQKPSALEDIDAPLAEEGIEIPVLFGTRDFIRPNVVWYGDLRTVAIKSKGGKK